MRLYWKGGYIDTLTEDDGFFKFEWQSPHEISTGWHPVKVDYIDICSANDLHPIAENERDTEPLVICAAVNLEGVRLIDNILV